MTQDPQAAATKEDIQMVMDMIGRMIMEMDEKIKASEERTKQHVFESEKRTKHHFDVVAENLHYDMVGVHKDRIDRIKRLEDHTDVLAA